MEKLKSFSRWRNEFPVLILPDSTAPAQGKFIGKIFFPVAVATSIAFCGWKGKKKTKWSDTSRDKIEP
jgi:hypothetical protein